MNTIERLAVDDRASNAGQMINLVNISNRTVGSLGHDDITRHNLDARISAPLRWAPGQHAHPA